MNICPSLSNLVETSHRLFTHLSGAAFPGWVECERQVRTERKIQHCTGSQVTPGHPPAHTMGLQRCPNLQVHPPPPLPAAQHGLPGISQQPLGKATSKSDQEK